MEFRNVPVTHPRPDAGEFIDIVLGRREQTRTPLVEYIVDDVVMKPIVRELLGREWAEPVDAASRTAFLDNFIEFWYRMGYDHVRFEQGLPFAEHSVVADDPAPGSAKKRGWKDTRRGFITTWEEFERYPWPKVEEFDFSGLEYLAGQLPDGMGFISCHAGGVFEHVSGIMSLEGLCIALLEEPELVRAVADKVGGLLLAFHRRLLEFDTLIAVFQGDDMGFKTQPLIGPDEMRRYFLVWHKRFAEQSHAHGRPYFLHSCGNIELIMESVIEDVEIDAKHSYEDVIIPVKEFQARYGSRIGVLGGLDLNILSGATPDDVRRRTRELIERCGGRGRYAVGSGNSVPSYVPVGNYLTMVDEAVAAMA